jgi:hypothetical protein
MPQAPSKTTIGTFHPFIQSLPSDVQFSKSLEGSKGHNLTETLCGPKIPSNLRLISLLSTTVKLFVKVILKIFQKHIEEKGLLNASQFGFRACYSTALQFIRLMYHVTHNFSNKMFTAPEFLDIEKAFDTTRHSGLLYKLSKLQFSNSQAKLIGSFLSQSKFTVSVEDKISTPREMQTGIPQGSVVSSTSFLIYT